jgi:hypothetical protein
LNPPELSLYHNDQEPNALFCVGMYAERTLPPSPYVSCVSQAAELTGLPLPLPSSVLVAPPAQTPAKPPPPAASPSPSPPRVSPSGGAGAGDGGGAGRGWVPGRGNTTPGQQRRKEKWRARKGLSASPPSSPPATRSPPAAQSDEEEGAGERMAGTASLGVPVQLCIAALVNMQMIFD